MKTRTFTPSFYLANKDFLFTISAKTVIGRNSGDIVLEEDELLSSVHCELSPRLMEIFVKDLNSTNGTFINDQKIFPAQEVKLSIGDKVKIGTGVYTVFDNIKEAKKLQPSDRRLNPRPDNFYSPANFFTFFESPSEFRFLYVGVLIFSIVAFAINLKLNAMLPAHLEFISKLYSDQILQVGLQTIVLVYIVSLCHGLAMQIYFNRNPLRKIFGFIVYAIILGLWADHAYGPINNIKLYATQRQQIEQLTPDSRAIVYLKTLTDSKNKLKHGHKEVKKHSQGTDIEVLDKDYEALLAKLDLEINKVGKLLK